MKAMRCADRAPGRVVRHARAIIRMAADHPGLDLFAVASASCWQAINITRIAKSQSR